MFAESLVITPRKIQNMKSKSVIQSSPRFIDPQTDFSKSFMNYSSKFETFFKLFPQKRVSPDIMIQYKRLSKAFDILHHQYSRTLRKASVANENIIIYCNSFTTDWIEFLRLYMSIANIGCGPQITEINYSFDVLYDSLKELRSLMTDEKFKTDVGCKAILSTQKSINSIRKIVQKLFIKNENDESKNDEEFNEKSFTERMKKLGDDISLMFMRSLTHQCLKRSDEIRIHAAMNSACLSIRDNVIAATRVPECEYETRSSIKELNEQTKKVFAVIGAPFGVIIDFENEYKNKIEELLA